MGLFLLAGENGQKNSVDVGAGGMQFNDKCIKRDVCFGALENKNTILYHITYFN